MGERRRKKIPLPFCCCFLLSFSLPGLKAADRTSVQNEWMEEKIPVIVATISFGMGVDKANVRCVRLSVVHHQKGKPQSPCSLSHLTQMPDKHLLNPTNQSWRYFILEAGKTNLEGLCKEIKTKAPELPFGSHLQT